MSSNDPHPDRPRFVLELEALAPSDLQSLLAYARHRRRLWLVAIPGVGLIVL